MQYHLYNTGDQIWTSQRYGQRVVVKVLTHDGLLWEEGENRPLHKLEGMELTIHKITTFCVRLILKVLNG